MDIYHLLISLAATLALVGWALAGRRSRAHGARAVDLQIEVNIARQRHASECGEHGHTRDKLRKLYAERLMPVHSSWEPMTDGSETVHVVHLADAPDSDAGWLAVVRDNDEAERYAEWLRTVPRPDGDDEYTQNVGVIEGYLTGADSVLFWNDTPPAHQTVSTDWARNGDDDPGANRCTCGFDAESGECERCKALIRRVKAEQAVTR